MPRRWTLDDSAGDLLVRTDVEGRAARVGHRLTLVMTSWTASVDEGPSGPVALDLRIDVAGLQVREGVGGLKPLSAPEKAVVRQTALRALRSSRYPQIRFRSSELTEIADGYAVTGLLEIRGVALHRTVQVHVSPTPEGARYHGEQIVTQSDFGLHPVTLVKGALRVRDQVTVSFSATRRFSEQ